MTLINDDKLNEVAAKEGLRVSNRIFARRGNHSEIHLSREELAVIVGGAFAAGVKAAAGAIERRSAQ